MLEHMPFDLDTILVIGKPDRTYADKAKSKQTRHKGLFPPLRQPMSLSGNMASSLLLYSKNNSLPTLIKVLRKQSEQQKL